jgi:hypothetical protein
LAWIPCELAIRKSRRTAARALGRSSLAGELPQPESLTDVDYD